MSRTSRTSNLEHLAYLAGTAVMVMATVQPDGRPHLSVVTPWVHGHHADISLTDRRIKTRNLRTDGRMALIAVSADQQRFVVAEGNTELTEISTTPGDATGQRLADVYRAIAGEHPDWDDYYQAMVSDRRLVARVNITNTYDGGTHT